MLTFSLGNKFAIFLMVVLVILGGVYSSAKLKLELLPDAENPVISVQTTMPGATPQTTQDEISSKIDNQVRSLAYVKSVETQSIQNASIVTVEYNNGTDMDKAEEVLKKEIDKSIIIVGDFKYFVLSNCQTKLTKEYTRIYCCLVTKSCLTLLQPLGL